MFKNVASQKIALFVYDATTGAPKTGDGANLTPYVSKDYGTVTVLGTVTATEMDATNAKGWYSFALAQAETNGDALLFTGKSSTANIFIVGALVYTDPPNFSSFLLNSSGQVDVIKLNGTSQTARDIGASVITASGTVTTVTNQLTAAQIATGVWQDTTAGDFTTALSIGKSIMNGVSLGTGLTINDLTTKTGYSLSGTQTFNVTGNITGNLSGSVGSVTGLTPATIATGIWQDTTAGDFTTAGSIGKSLGGAFSALGTSVYTSGALANAPSGGLTGAQIATAVWTDTVAGDFTTALSIGTSVMNGVSLGTGLTINGYTGNTPQTGDGFARLGAPAGASVSADIAAVETNAVGIKTQTDKFAFTVANKVDANTIAVNGNAAAANNVAHSMQAIVRGTCSGGTTATAVASAITSPATLTAAGQLIGRTIIFDADTVTAALQGQASNITNSTTGATPTITFTAMTSAPATGDTFSVV